jgi:hypothetical protein
MKPYIEKKSDRVSKRAREKQNRIGDGTDNLFFKHNLAIAIYHIPSGLEVAFKAMITSFSENYASSWNEEDVYGRTDPIVTFNNTKRTISLGWQVAGSTVDECRSNLGRIGLLLNMLYPTYELHSAVTKKGPFPLGTISASPLVKLKFTNMISDSSLYNGSFLSAKRDGLLGKIGSVSVEPDADAGYVQVALGGLLPKIVNVSLDFLVIHENPVGWGHGPNKKIATFDSGKIRGAEEFGEFPYGASHVPRNPPPFEPDSSVATVTRDSDDDVVVLEGNPLTIVAGPGVVTEELNGGIDALDRRAGFKNKRSGPENSIKAFFKSIFE